MYHVVFHVHGFSTRRQVSSPDMCFVMPQMKGDVMFDRTQNKCVISQRVPDAKASEPFWFVCPMTCLLYSILVCAYDTSGRRQNERPELLFPCCRIRISYSFDCIAHRQVKLYALGVQNHSTSTEILENDDPLVSPQEKKKGRKKNQGQRKTTPAPARASPRTKEKEKHSNRHKFVRLFWIKTTTFLLIHNPAKAAPPPYSATKAL